MGIKIMIPLGTADSKCRGGALSPCSFGDVVVVLRLCRGCFEMVSRLCRDGDGVAIRVAISASAGEENTILLFANI